MFGHSGLQTSRAMNGNALRVPRNLGPHRGFAFTWVGKASEGLRWALLVTVPSPPSLPLYSPAPPSQASSVSVSTNCSSPLQIFSRLGSPSAQFRLVCGLSGVKVVSLTDIVPVFASPLLGSRGFLSDFGSLSLAPERLPDLGDLSL